MLMKRISDLLRASARRGGGGSHRGSRRRGGRGGDQSGNVALETALLAPPLLMFALALINGGYVLWLQNALDISVADAARCAAVNPSRCGTASQVTAYAADRSGAGFDGSIFSFASDPSCGSRVSASYPLSLSLAFASYSLTLSAQACYPSSSS